MAPQKTKLVRFGVVITVIVAALGFLAWTGVQESKSYYVTIAELHKMGNGAESRRLRVAGNVQPGSIHQLGTNADFVLVEQDPNTKQVDTIRVSYKGTEPPPDTFKDNSQALVQGEYGKDGVFHAHTIEAKCASHYAPQQGAATAESSTSTPASSKTY
jgi:cytochrome c-type biogenesis protein CcmE